MDRRTFLTTTAAAGLLAFPSAAPAQTTPVRHIESMHSLADRILAARGKRFSLVEQMTPSEIRRLKYLPTLASRQNVHGSFTEGVFRSDHPDGFYWAVKQGLCYPVAQIGDQGETILYAPFEAGVLWAKHTKGWAIWEAETENGLEVFTFPPELRTSSKNFA